MVRPPYEAAVRLSAAAIGNWDALDGYHSGQGVDLLRLPPSRFFNVVMYWVASRIENPEVWLGRLADPLPGRARRRSEVVAQQEAQDFAQFASFAKTLEG